MNVLRYENPESPVFEVLMPPLRTGWNDYSRGPPHQDERHHNAYQISYDSGIYKSLTTNLRTISSSESTLLNLLA